MRERPGEHERPDVALLVDDDQCAGAGPVEQAVDVGGPVLEVGPEDDSAALVEGARAVRPLPDVDPQVGDGGPARFGHGVSSPLSRPESAEATLTLPGRGPRGPAHLYQSFPARRPAPVATPPGPSAGQGQTAIRGGRSATIGTAQS